MSNQPKWKCIENIGDVNPLDYGGLFVFIDTTGVYPPEVEKIEPPEEEGGIYTIYRLVCEPCTYIEGILSDNKYHQDYPVWFADLIEEIGAEGLISQLCSTDPIEQASAYVEVADHHGWSNFDMYPLTLSLKETTKRVRRYEKQLEEVKS